MYRFIAIIALIIMFATGAAAQKTGSLLTEKSLFWSNADPAVEVLIIDRWTNFNLLVISEKEIVLTYRTSVNSSRDIIEKIEPVRVEGCRKYFLVKHNFSRTTIWMALDIDVDGKPVPALTRTFYDGLLEIVPNEQFRKDLPK